MEIPAPAPMRRESSILPAISFVMYAGVIMGSGFPPLSCFDSTQKCSRKACNSALPLDHDENVILLKKSSFRNPRPPCRTAGRLQISTTYSAVRQSSRVRKNVGFFQQNQYLFIAPPREEEGRESGHTHCQVKIEDPLTSIRLAPYQQLSSGALPGGASPNSRGGRDADSSGCPT